MISFFKKNTNSDYEELAYNFTFKELDGGNLKLSEYKDKVMVVINVASKCGFTNQYEDMQKIWRKYESRGLIMLGVPSNNFGSQEPGTNEEIKIFCEAKFGVSFQMTEKVNVEGKDAHPFYIWAKDNHGKSAIPKWNFHKIIIGKDGKIAETFTSITNPSSKKFIETLENLLNS